MNLASAPSAIFKAVYLLLLGALVEVGAVVGAEIRAVAALQRLTIEPCGNTLGLGDFEARIRAGFFSSCDARRFRGSGIGLVAFLRATALAVGLFFFARAGGAVVMDDANDRPNNAASAIILFMSDPLFYH